MKNNHFFAMLSRMKYINRWGLMRNTRSENICEHSLEVAFIAHALGVINREEFGGDVDEQKLALMGMYHDVTEIVTGDMPTPIKYYNPGISKAYKEVEKIAGQELLEGLPDRWGSYYAGLLVENEEDEQLWRYVKAADKLSALIKCIEEKKMGNSDFLQAEMTITAAIKAMNMPEAEYFMENFIPAYEMTIDESGNE